MTGSLLDTLRDTLADRYAVEREIGAGGMATVYLARDLRHGRSVAVKVLHAELGAALGVERFLTEIRVTAALQHPNLLPLFDSGQVGDVPYYVMPFVEGESLRARLARETQLPLEDAVRIAVTVAGALDYAHRQGVVHRDLKPENILLQDGQPLVADFGIALAVSMAAGGRLTRSGQTIGTPQYMAPEQAAGSREVDGRADLYALAVILYEMLSGEPPHTGPTVQAVIARILSEKPRNLAAVREAVPEHVAWAVERALAKLPADRFATGREFAEALAEPAIMLRRTPRPAMVPTITGAGQVRRVLGLAGVAAVTLAAGVGAGLWVANRGTAPIPTVRFHLPLPRGFVLQGPVPLAVSPEGRLLALVVREEGQPDTRVMLRRLEDTQLQPIPGTEGARQIAFSPDGRWLAFDAGGVLRKVPVSGGTALVIGEVPELFGLSWGRADVIVVSSEGRLASIPAAGGRVRPFSAPRGDAREIEQRFPQLLADGRTIVYTSRTRFLEQSRLSVARLGDSVTTPLEISGTAPLGMVAGFLVYSTARSPNERNDLMAVLFDPSSRMVRGEPAPVLSDVVIGGQGWVHAALSSSRTLVLETREVAPSELVIVEPGKEAQVALAEPRDYLFPRVSPDGQRVSVSFHPRDSRLNDVHILELATGALVQVSRGDGGGYAEWTPDGTRVLYSKGTGEGRWLWWRRADLNGPEELLFRSESTATAAGLNAPEQRGSMTGVMHPDGETLVLRMNLPTGEREIWSWRRASEEPPLPVVGSPLNPFNPRLSPDGRWLAFSTGGRVLITPFPGPGPRFQISTASGTQPVWAPDGRRLFYLSGDTLLAAHLQFAPTFAVTRRDTLFRGEYRFFGVQNPGYDVFPDGRRFVALRALPLSGLPALGVIQGWRPELQARMGTGGGN